VCPLSEGKRGNRGRKLYLTFLGILALFLPENFRKKNPEPDRCPA
jgi:hypothetical protein